MSETLQEFKSIYPVRLDVDLQWGDMDALSHINNVVYFRYFENIRIAYMARTSLIGNPEYGPVLGAAEARYRRPLTFPDHIHIGARVATLHEYGCEQEYGIYSEQQDAVVTQGKARIVIVDARTGRKAPLTDGMRAEIEALEGKTLEMVS
ncbi:MAG: thioesterase family protein [Natronospirillum sp.]|uniref:acyl-CoA thioesterase n=1 Tax=Natronospirillum sp. TaxID=2812955 RepID=UPI0025EFACF8|nr:thioesterase family protein [Natronospirillum sp.]MCH8552063.1 thioesterase family protein [Natronospirillum sp.]